jgi:hypothetical protein
MREKERDGSIERPQPEKLRPKDDFRPPLFQDRVETAENLLNREVRGQVERVILSCNLTGLSFPLMFSSLLAQYLPKNFLNAEFVDFTGLMKIVKMRGDQRLRTPTVSFSECGFSEGWGRSVHFYPGILFSNPTAKQSEQANALTLFLEEFGQKANVVELKQPGYDKVSFKVGVREDERIQKVKDKQVRLLRQLGFDILPEAGEHSILTAEEYSRELEQTITRVGGKISEVAGDKPVIFVNTTKRHRKDYTRTDALNQRLSELVREVDATYIVNKGAGTGGEAHMLQKQGDELFRQLKSVGGERVLDFGTFDLTHLAALMVVADRTGGCTVDLLGGTSILADWLGTREAMVELPEWDHLTIQRDNLAVIKEGNLDELKPKVNELLERRA